MQNTPDTTPHTQSTGPSEINPQTKPIFDNKWLLPIVIIVLTVIVGSFFVLSTRKSSQLSLKPVEITPFATPTPKPKYIDSIDLMLRNSQGISKVLTFNHQDVELLRWKDFLFFSERGTIFRHDISTGTSSAIFQADSKPDGPSQLLGIHDIEIINDTLYFSTGAYLSSGYVYYMDLEKPGDPTFLVSAPNTIFRKHSNNYWLISGEGDSCWSESSFRTLDINTKSVRHFVDTSNGCASNGREGFTAFVPDHMLINTRIYSTESMNVVKYTSLSLIPFNNSTERIRLLTTESMPVNTSYISYNADLNKILIYGDPGVFIYDIAEKQQNFITDLPKNQQQYDNTGFSTIAWENSTLCVSLNSKPYVIDTVKKTKTETKSCPIEPKNERADEWNDLIERIKALKLPSSYSIETHYE